MEGEERGDIHLDDSSIEHEKISVSMSMNMKQKKVEYQ